MDIISKMLELKTWAVVGATDNQNKFGYKIFKMMLESGYEVYPVNPGIQEVLGKKCYSSLSELPIVPQAVDMVVSPKIGERIVRECGELGIQNIWFQPGASSQDLLNLCEHLNLNVVNACIMVEIRQKGG